MQNLKIADRNVGSVSRDLTMLGLNPNKRHNADFNTVLIRVASDNYLRAGMPLHSRACVMAIGEEVVISKPLTATDIRRGQVRF